MTMTCIKPLIHQDEYGEVRCIPGRTRAAENDPLVSLYRDHWRTLPGSKHGARERYLATAGGTATIQTALDRSGARDEPLGTEAWRVLGSSPAARVANRVGPVMLRISPVAFAQIKDHIAVGTERDSLEQGGLLLGVLSPGALFEVLGASGSGADSERSTDSLRFDPAHLRTILDGAETASIDCIGCWHTHPDPRRAIAAPSDADCEAFTQMREMLGAHHFLALIAAPVKAGWTLVPWVISESVGRDRIERGTLIEPLLSRAALS